MKGHDVCIQWNGNINISNSFKPISIETFLTRATYHLFCSLSPHGVPSHLWWRKSLCFMPILISCGKKVLHSAWSWRAYVAASCGERMQHGRIMFSVTPACHVCVFLCRYTHHAAKSVGTPTLRAQTPRLRRCHCYSNGVSRSGMSRGMVHWPSRVSFTTTKAVENANEEIMSCC